MKARRTLTKALALAGAALLMHSSSSQAEVIADSRTEFSGVQGQDNWFNGYRFFQEGETDDYDPSAAFIQYAGGTGQGDWDGFTQIWDEPTSTWDLNTAGAAPWTAQASETLHPNGINNAEIHFNIRRWVAEELTGVTPLAITWNTRKQNTGGGNGVTGMLFRNGIKLGTIVVPGTDGVGQTRTNYVNASKGDIFDLVLSPKGTDGTYEDGADGSFNWMTVNTTLPEVPRQPDNSIFIPVNSPDTDGDGLADFWENVFFPGNLATMNGTGDQDGDGKTNRQEQDQGLDPTNADTDGDGLRDGVETDTGIFVSATNTGTNPRIADTDGDGRSDGAEVNGPPTSNPLLVDTDDDGFSDNSEANSGHDPNDAGNNPDTTPIADSMAEFSGTQGQNDWHHGYRNVTGDGAITDYAVDEFIPFPGGETNFDPWDGTTQVWTGSIWDLNTASAGPWTELGPEGTHPNGPSPVHWVVRRWEASRLTGVTPMALRYSVRKTNTGCGNGVTAGLFVNGRRLDHVAIAGNNGTGVTRTAFANLAPTDVVDLILSPRGANNDNEDGCDGSAFRLSIDPTMPMEPRQPDGTLFIPANAADADADGIPDAWERQYGGNLTAFSRTGDFDNDGLTDLNEYLRDSNPTVGDTDGDGLPDMVESATGNYVSPTDTGSSPKQADSDGDGLSDFAEVNGTPRTNPNRADSDSDGFNDPAEIAAGTNPNDAADNPLTFVIANSQAEFSGEQGKDGWFNGYRNYTMDGGETNYDPAAHFIPFPGGVGQGDWDGVNQMWTGTAWDLNTSASGPWTEQGALSLHPNGVNSFPNEEHWVIRRWVASELTQETPVGIVWNVRKNASAGNGVTGSLHVNGQQVDVRTVPGSDTTGQTRRFFVNLKPGDIVDLAVTPEGVSNREDGSDGSSSWMWVDTRLPREPRQPNGALFIPAGAADSDGDGLLDFWERIYADNLTTLTGTGDNDNDGVNNTTEFTRDSNPLSEDSDGDGLNDSVETKTGTFANANNTGTDPRLADTDGDGLSDGDEVRVHGTNPVKTDTDDDTFSDGSEVASGHNPNDAGSNPNTSMIADSRTEFSGAQGQDGWFYGYRNYTTDGSQENYEDADFIQFTAEQWNGTMWDLNPAATGPWTELGVENSHPNGVNSAPGQEHWTVRRWVASELTGETPVALRWLVRKNNGSPSGVTGALYINGEKVDSRAIAGSDTTGQVRTYYANLKPTDKVDLVHTPVGPTGDRADGSDSSSLWLQVDSVLPPNPVQPDGTPFIRGDVLRVLGVTIANGRPTIRWQSRAGENYTVQGSQTLLPDSWTNLATGIASAGAETTYTDNTAQLPPYRFYRVLRQQQ